ncbi:unnamed protein product, partial [Durusdinium trenchii]
AAACGKCIFQLQGHEAAEKACADLTSAKNDLEEAWKAVRELADDTEDDAWESK